MTKYNTSNIPQISPHASQGPLVSTARAWLERWPTARRSLIANIFHAAVRNGASTPDTVVAMVMQDLQRRLRWDDDATLTDVLRHLQTETTPARLYAQTVIEWEHLPYDERQRQKAARAAPFVLDHMRALPVTERQAACLRALGYTGTPPADRAAASLLIDELRRGREGGRP